MNDLQIFENAEFEKLKDITPQCFFGYVYVLECENEVKIGKTETPYKRISNIAQTLDKYAGRSISRVALSVKHTNYSENETKLHKIFANYRLRNSEFFDLDFDYVVEQINEIIDIEYKDESERLKKEEDIWLEKFKEFAYNTLGIGKCNFYAKTLGDAIIKIYKRKKEIEENCPFCRTGTESDPIKPIGVAHNLYELDSEENDIFVTISEGRLTLFPHRNKKQLCGYEWDTKILFCPMCGRWLWD